VDEPDDGFGFAFRKNSGDGKLDAAGKEAGDALRNAIGEQIRNARNANGGTLTDADFFRFLGNIGGGVQFDAGGRDVSGALLDVRQTAFALTNLLPDGGALRGDMNTLFDEKAGRDTKDTARGNLARAIQRSFDRAPDPLTAEDADRLRGAAFTFKRARLIDNDAYDDILKKMSGGRDLGDTAEDLAPSRDPKFTELRASMRGRDGQSISDAEFDRRMSGVLGR
jgi:hypothetical protein